MEAYFKRFFIGHLIILLIVGVAILFFGGSRLIAILLFVGLVEVLFYYLDTKYLPNKRAELSNKLIEIFKAEPFSEGILRFKIRTIEFFAKIVIDFKKGLQLASIETIEFHIPKTQIDQLLLKPGHELIDDQINGIQTYGIYQTNAIELKLVKEDLEKMVRR
jgi:hypothetical protein